MADPSSPGHVSDVLRVVPVFRKLAPDDLARLAAVSTLGLYPRGAVLFREGDPARDFFVIGRGRVKVVKSTRAGKDVILEIFGPGDPVGAVAVYENRPYPATAVALEETRCILVPRTVFFQLLEQYPSLVRGLLLGLTERLVELTRRLADLTGGRVEQRFARLFLKLAGDLGRPRPDGVFVPLPLSRQELADLTGTTVETSIRIMSRWGKQGIVRTGKEGFTVCDRRTLELLSEP